MVNNDVPVFKEWVPEWMIRAVIFMVILPSMGLFGLSTANGAAAAGYYGIEPADVQYSMIIFYAAVTSFFALERRFFQFVIAKQYLVIATIIQAAASYICYKTHNLHVLFVFRFLQGMANAATTSICITLIFGRLHSERSREIGYSVFYCILLCISPFTTIVTAPVIDAFDFNVLYKCIIFLYLPGTALLFIMLNNVRLNRKFPLYQLDIASFIIYAVALCLIGYVLAYGQQYEWFGDKRIVYSVIAIIFLLAFHILRQSTLKRPYINLQVFKYRNYKIGALLVFILYICRGAMTVTTSYFSTVLGMDPTHVGYTMLPNIAGIIVSVIVASRLVVLQKPMRFIWMTGFLFLLVFHLWMRFLFAAQADAPTFIFPLFIQGLGAGMLMTPIIVFMVSSVPQHLGLSASAIGVFFRFTAFSTSIALINFFQLFGRSEHFNRFQQSLTDMNPLLTQRLATYKQALVSRGMLPDAATRVANGLLNRYVSGQAQLRFAMDYYDFISWLILIVILLIALFPYLNKTVINVRRNQPAAAVY